MKKEKIMIVEDEYIIAQDIKEKLGEMGYGVTCIASTGEEAIQRAEKDRPRLILMDIVLRDEMDGIEAANRIRGRLGIPIIFLTAYSDDASLQRAKITEPFGYLLKPFTSDNLRVAIEMSLYKAKMEKVLKESEEKFHLLYENAPLAYQSLNEEGIIVDVNRAWLRMLGYKKREAIGCPFVEFLTPESISHFGANLPCQDKKKRVHEIELEMVRNDGATIKVSLTRAVHRDDAGSPKNTYCIMQDISERKRMEQALKDSEEKYRAVVQNANEGILVAQDGFVKFMNNAGFAFTNYSREDLFNKPFINLIHPDDRQMVIDRHLKRLAGEDVPKRYSLRYLGPEGGVRWMEISVVAIIWEEKPATLNFLTDITERKQAEEEREKLIEQLQEALAKVKTLSGFLPICASCKKIRDDKGYWKQIETYIRDHSEADFSHCICPECSQKLYPELYRGSSKNK